MNIFTKIVAAASFMIAAVGFSTPSEAGFFTSFAPQPSVTAKVSLSKQVMVVDVRDRRGDKQRFVWNVSTGKSGFETPKGQWRPRWLAIDHKSSQYDDAPMPYSVFFVGGYAVHGTDATSKLGQPASHGCVRLAQNNAATFYKLVEAYGKSNTKIIVTD